MKQGQNEMKSREVFERCLLGALIVILVLQIACSGSRQTNTSVSDEENPQGASVSWDDAIFGTDYFSDIDSKDENFRFEVKPENRRELINRGSYLVNSVAACGSCHGSEDSSLKGGKVMADSFGEVVVPNITADQETGIGNWTNAEIIKAIRGSLNKENSLLSPDSHAGYRWISDTDAVAIAAYLKSTIPLANKIERRQLSDFDEKTLGLIEKNRQVLGYVPSPPQSESAEYGRYLAVQVAGCSRCHHSSEGVFSEAEPFSGTEDYAEEGAPDIRGKTGRLQHWSIKDYESYLSSGKATTGEGNNGARCPWPYYSTMKDSDKRAIAKLLKSL